jgi:hypothetical protein
MEQWITVPHASKLLGVGPRQVRHYCEDGKLVSKKVGKSYSIELESVRKRLRSNEPLEDLVDGSDMDDDADILQPEGSGYADTSDNGADIEAEDVSEIITVPEVDESVYDPDMEEDSDAMSDNEMSDIPSSNGHPANGNGHSPNGNRRVRIESEMSGHADIPPQRMSANSSEGFLDMEEEHLLNRIEKLKRTLDDQLAGHQESVSQIKGVLSSLAEGFTVERGKTRKTQNTLTSLLDELEQPYQ